MSFQSVPAVIASPTTAPLETGDKTMGLRIFAASCPVGEDAIAETENAIEDFGTTLIKAEVSKAVAARQSMQ